MLVGLVGLVGFSIAIVDDVLEARLPHPPRGVGRSTIAYLIVTLLGLVLILPPTVGILLGGPEYQRADPGRLGAGGRGRVHARMVGASRAR